MQHQKTKIPDGSIVRHAQTGALVSVATASMTSLAKPKSRKVVAEISTRRSEALKRLVNR